MVPGGWLITGWLIAITARVLCLAVKSRRRERPGTQLKKNHFRRGSALVSCLVPPCPLQTASMSESQVVSTIIDDRDPGILYLPDPSDWTVHTEVGAQYQLHGNTDTFRLDIMLQGSLKLY